MSFVEGFGNAAAGLMSPSPYIPTAVPTYVPMIYDQELIRDFRMGRYT